MHIYLGDDPSYFIELKDVIKIESLFSAFHFHFEPNYNFDGEAHVMWELMYIKDGELSVQSGEEEFLMHKGEAILYPPLHFHAHRCSNGSASVMVVSFMSSSQALMDISKRIFSLNKQESELLHSFIFFAASYFENDVSVSEERPLTHKDTVPFGYLQVMSNTLENMFISLCQRFKEDRKQSPEKNVFLVDETIVDILHFMQDNIYTNITMDDIAKRYNWSLTYIKLKFKKHTGVSIMQYYKSLKIMEAKKLICEGNDSLTTISEKLGFASLQHFSKAFRIHTGLSPREYAKQHCEK